MLLFEWQGKSTVTALECALGIWCHHYLLEIILCSRWDVMCFWLLQVAIFELFSQERKTKPTAYYVEHYVRFFVCCVCVLMVVRSSICFLDYILELSTPIFIVVKNFCALIISLQSYCISPYRHMLIQISDHNNHDTFSFFFLHFLSIKSFVLWCNAQRE